MFPKSLRQRCLAHRIRNLEAKVPAELWPEVKGQAHAAYRASSPALARLPRDEFVKRFEASSPTSKRASRICVYRLHIAAQSELRTCWSACSAKSVDVRR